MNTMKTKEDATGVWLDLPTIRQRIDAGDELMLHWLAERTFLVRMVGRIKHAEGKTLQASDREAEVFSKMRRECERLGLNGDYVSELWSTMMFFSKVTECQEVGIDSFLEHAPIPAETLRQNLLELTEATAANYDEYCTGDGTNAMRAYRAGEHLKIEKAISHDLPGRECAIDLGCATGQVTELLERHFLTVRAFDCSPHMCTEAQRRRTWKDGVSFEGHDLSTGIPATDASVDFVVANFGSASEMGPNLLPEIRRVLKPGGRALLSHYNSDALLNYWFYPWPSTVRARLNRHNGTIEVWTSNRVYTVEAQGMTVAGLETDFQDNGLDVVELVTYPTIQAILPKFFFSSQHADADEMTRIAQRIDEHLAESGLHRGTYIVTEVQKTK